MTSVAKKPIRFVIEGKRRPGSHWAHYQRALRKAELAYVSELRHEANYRTNKRLELMNLEHMLKGLYRKELYNDALTLQARKAALESDIKRSLGL